MPKFWRLAHERTNGLVLPPDDRIRIAAACFHLAQEHHDAIIVLVRARLYGSAWALARSLLEDMFAASGSSNTHAGGLRTLLKRRMPEILRTGRRNWNRAGNGRSLVGRNEEQVLVGFKRVHPRRASQVTRRNTADAIEPAYGDVELRALLAFAREVAMRVGRRAFPLAGQESLLEQLRERHLKYHAAPTRLPERHCTSAARLKPNVNAGVPLLPRSAQLCPHRGGVNACEVPVYGGNLRTTAKTRPVDLKATARVA